MTSTSVKTIVIRCVVQHPRHLDHQVEMGNWKQLKPKTETEKLKLVKTSYQQLPFK